LLLSPPDPDGRLKPPPNPDPELGDPVPDEVPKDDPIPPPDGMAGFGAGDGVIGFGAVGLDAAGLAAAAFAFGLLLRAADFFALLFFATLRAPFFLRAGDALRVFLLLDFFAFLRFFAITFLRIYPLIPRY
jgi:hypothetical protein